MNEGKIEKCKKGEKKPEEMMAEKETKGGAVNENRNKEKGNEESTKEKMKS